MSYIVTALVSLFFFDRRNCNVPFFFLIIIISREKWGGGGSLCVRVWNVVGVRGECDTRVGCM